MLTYLQLLWQQTGRGQHRSGVMQLQALAAPRGQGAPVGGPVPQGPGPHTPAGCKPAARHIQVASSFLSTTSSTQLCKHMSGACAAECPRAGYLRGGRQLYSHLSKALNELQGQLHLMASAVWPLWQTRGPHTCGVVGSGGLDIAAPARCAGDPQVSPSCSSTCCHTAGGTISAPTNCMDRPVLASPWCCHVQ